MPEPPEIMPVEIEIVRILDLVKILIIFLGKNTNEGLLTLVRVYSNG